MSVSVRAVWNGVVVAETSSPLLVEGNYYFPSEDCHRQYFRPSETSTHCPWKGDASYYSLELGGEQNLDCAWTYAEPTEAAAQLKAHFAFWRGVEIVRPSLSERRAPLASPLEELANRVGQPGNQNLDARFDAVAAFLQQLGPEEITMLLPRAYVIPSSFFNYANSNHICFHANADFVIEQTNRTFDWALDHLDTQPGLTIDGLLSQMEVVEGPDVLTVLKRLRSYGWIQVPKLRTQKDGEDLYFRLDIAITKHGDREELTGFQGQFVDITRQEQLAQDIAVSEANMRAILGGLDEGLFFFGSDGKLSQQRSSALERIAPCTASVATLPDFFEGLFEETAGSTALAVDLMYSDDFVAPFEHQAQMFPQRAQYQHPERGPRHLRFDYRALLDDQDKLSKTLVIVHDETETLHNEAEARRQLERVERIRRASASPTGFASFVDETSRLVEETTRLLGADHLAPEERPTLERHLHTIKGICATFAFNEMAQRLHEIEQELLEADHHEAIRGSWSWVLEHWPAAVQDVKQLLGPQADPNFVLVPRARIDHLEHRAAAVGDASLVQLVQGLGTQPLQRLLHKYTILIERLNQRHDDKSVRVVFDPQSIELDPTTLTRLDAALVHLFRNAFDHGIETRETRERVGKAPVGVIRCAAHRTQDGVTLTIADDGSGVATDRLVEKATSRGVWTAAMAETATLQQKLDLMFADRLSSRDEATDLSGRGVGMGAVRAHVESLNGTVGVTSKEGQGTTFTLTLPTETRSPLPPVLA